MIGGELLIPIPVLMFGLNLKHAESESLAIILPTMQVGFARYNNDNSFAELRRHQPLVLAMIARSVDGAATGDCCWASCRRPTMLPMMVVGLLVSALKLLHIAIGGASAPSEQVASRD